jgi:hypothetical protein
VSKKLGIALLASSIVVGGVTALILILTHGTETGTSASGSSASPAPSDAGQAHEVAVALEKLSTDPDSLVSSSSRGQVGGSARDAVPAGTRVTVDENSWASDGLGGGTIEVGLITRTSNATYLAVMVREADEWKVVATIPIIHEATASSAPGPTR